MAKTHCENCGRKNPSTIQGYTCCCDALVCDGLKRYKFGIPSNYVIACCWAVAAEIFAEREQAIPEGSCILD